ncbi:MAG: hypothetical protein ABEJ26_02225 [Halosimplex sp.]
MLEVVCEDCRTVQTTTLADSPTCEVCGSRSLTGTAGYESPDARDSADSPTP